MVGVAVGQGVVHPVQCGNEPRLADRLCGPTGTLPVEELAVASAEVQIRWGQLDSRPGQPSGQVTLGVMELLVSTRNGSPAAWGASMERSASGMACSS
jgi:hypothetical protein